jgi:aspartyl-tRNA(Asn)/glutamyl-tRNA(Gln) amidotransferase subunit A
MAQNAGLSMRSAVASLAEKGNKMQHVWSTMSAIALGAEIGAGRIDPVDLAVHFLDQIEAHEFGPRIYARTTPTRALAEAMAAASRAQKGLRRGPLDGVPISWKDLFDTSGTATEAGSALLAGRIPDFDAEVLARATRHGLVCLGKTHMSELAFSGLGLNPITATPPCVNDLDAVAGGSSSGAAASVAFGLAPAAIGSDTGGSVRVPAAWNDLVGLKTSIGVLPVTGTVPLCPRFDTIGPIARTVTDCAALLAAMQGEPAMDMAGVSLKGARLAVLETVAMDDLREEPARGFTSALSRLKGAVIKHIRLPIVSEAMTLAGLLFAPEGYAIWRSTIEAAPEKMFRPILDRFRSGAGVSASDYIAAWRRLIEIRAEYQAAVSGFDAVILPTSAILPPNAARLLSDDAYFAAENLLALRNTRIGNVLDQCVVTLPTGQSCCGISIMMNAGAEGRLLRLSLAVEGVLG